MSLYAEKCPCCGAAISFEFGCYETVCPFCSSIITKETHHSGIEDTLEKAELYLTKLGEPAKAEALFREAADTEPSNYRCWWGLARCLCGNFSDTGVSPSVLESIRDYVNKAVNVAPSHVKEKLLAKAQAYYDAVESSFAGHTGTLEEKIRRLEEHISELKKEETALRLAINKKNEEFLPLNKYNHKVISLKPYLILTGVLLFVVFGSFFSSGNSSVISPLSLAGPYAALIGVVWIVYFVKKSKRASAKNRMVELGEELSELQDKRDALNKEIAAAKEKLEELREQLRERRY